MHVALAVRRRCGSARHKDWGEQYGGHLQLWNRDMTRCEAKVSPIFNRVMIFSTTDFTYHGHLHPLQCPEGMTRKSLALYIISLKAGPRTKSAESTRRFFVRAQPKTCGRLLCSVPKSLRMASCRRPSCARSTKQGAIRRLSRTAGATADIPPEKAIGPSPTAYRYPRYQCRPHGLE